MASKDKGGLGVSSLFALNRDLMFKWVWHFISQISSLWARVIKALHGEDGKIGKKVKYTYPSIWLNIIHEVELLKLQGIDLLSFIHSMLGNGEKTSFWEVAWHGDSAFKDLFPRIQIPVVDAGLLERIVLSPSLNISHLFYADDAIFMGQWS
nr:RNA-directed DNA polymerase, eukaryota, reverse transcriptase zinc-binding domain protein [Tanacetum cinerariifolium]